ncbi:hypothetical protein QYE76_065595 [Lolium multiflorum]|uniref:V-type proton ATPase proteolipid subunit n=1 Tax=Lolium multiflorum TaxID=4521 RepID=A0AAD8SB80_LOLMU|nr:hypothetical protein QYE76_065595 [Lolium multiflorum]
MMRDQVAGVLEIYGLIIAVIISTVINPKAKPYFLFDGYAHLSSGLVFGLAGLAAGMAIGIVGDAGIGEANRRKLLGSTDPISGSPPVPPEEAMETPPPFQESANCDVCGCTFSTLQRREHRASDFLTNCTLLQHHCSCCGRTLCHLHSSYHMALPQYGIYTDARVCYECFNKSSSRSRNQLEKKQQPLCYIFQACCSGIIAEYNLDELPLPDEDELPLPDEEELPLPDEDELPLPDEDELPLPDEGAWRAAWRTAGWRA